MESCPKGTFEPQLSMDYKDTKYQMLETQFSILKVHSNFLLNIKYTVRKYMLNPSSWKIAREV